MTELELAYAMGIVLFFVASGGIVFSLRVLRRELALKGIEALGQREKKLLASERRSSWPVREKY